MPPEASRSAFKISVANLVRFVNGKDILRYAIDYARGNATNLITDDSVLYITTDKKRARNWFQVCGISVPLEGKQYGLIRSITPELPAVNKDSGEKRNSSRDSAGNQPSEKQQECFKDSKVRDKKG